MPMCIPTGLYFRKETAGVPGNALYSSSKQIQSSLNGLEASGRKEDDDLTHCGSEKLNSSGLQLNPIKSGRPLGLTVTQHSGANTKVMCPLHLMMGSEISHISQGHCINQHPTCSYYPTCTFKDRKPIQHRNLCWWLYNGPPNKNGLQGVIGWSEGEGGRKTGTDGTMCTYNPMGVMWMPGSKTEVTFQTVVARLMLLVMLCEAFSSAIWPNIQPVEKVWEINWRHRNS